MLIGDALEDDLFAAKGLRTGVGAAAEAKGDRGSGARESGADGGGAGGGLFPRRRDGGGGSGGSCLEAALRNDFGRLSFLYFLSSSVIGNNKLHNHAKRTPPMSITHTQYQYINEVAALDYHLKLTFMLIFC